MRYERKFRIENASPDFVKQAVRLLPFGPRPLHPGRRIHNIYFDTPSLDAYHDNSAGVGHRVKVRLRWYGDSDRPRGPMRLEVKERVMGQGGKRVIDLEAPPTFDLATIKELVRAELPDSPVLQPVLHNTYARSYLGVAHPKVRFTVDWDLRFQGLLFMESSVRASGAWLSDPAVILEVKYDAAHDDLIDEVFQHLPFRMTKNSKYVTGMELWYGR